MGVRALATRHLSAGIQDNLRSLIDALIPSRRQTGPLDAEMEDVVRRISPDGTVLAGPFTGMRLGFTGSWGGLGARLAGTYEEEIGDHLLALLDAGPSMVVDIGAAEGYYAVGAARRLPATPVVSFEIDPAARRICSGNALMNGVRNLDVRGRATPDELRKRVKPGALVICDCEGYEREIIDPATVPALATCSLLVEVHEFAVSGITQLIMDRFEASHTILLVDAVARSAQDRPQLASLSMEQAARVVDEGRPQNPPMQWAVMRPRQ